MTDDGAVKTLEELLTDTKALALQRAKEAELDVEGMAIVSMTANLFCAVFGAWAITVAKRWRARRDKCVEAGLETDLDECAGMLWSDSK